jgi:hypothetical protein
MFAFVPWKIIGLASKRKVRFGLMMKYLVQPWVICHGNLKTLIPSSTTQVAQKKSIALDRWFENRDTAMEVVVITL